MTALGFLLWFPGAWPGFFKGGVTEALYRCSPSCISGLNRIIAAWRPILTKDESRWRKYFTKKQILKKWAFQQWLLQPRYCHGVCATWIGCLLKRRPSKGGHRHPRTPLATPLIPMCFYGLEQYQLSCRSWIALFFLVNFSMPMILLCLLMRSSTWGRLVVLSRWSCFLRTEDMAVLSSQTWMDRCLTKHLVRGWLWF